MHVLKRIVLIISIVLNVSPMVNYPKTELVVFQQIGKFLAAIKANPNTLKSPTVINTLFSFNRDILQAILIKNDIEGFKSIFISKSSDEKFLNTIHGSRILIQDNEIRERFFSLNKEKILEFVSRPENAHTYEIIAKHSPDNIFRYLHNIGNKSFIENQYVCHRFNSLTPENKLIQNVKAPFIILKEITYNSLLKLIKNYYGSEKVDSDTEAYVKSIAQESWGIKNIHVQYIKKDILDANPNKKAFPIFNCLFINKDFFDSLSESEKRGLIAHELGHMRKNHYLIKCVYALADLAITGTSYGLAVINTKLFFNSNDNIGRFKALGSSTSCWAIAAALKHKLIERAIQNSYNQEFEADRYAAINLNSRQNLISFLEKATQEIDSHAFSSTHPSSQIRIFVLHFLDQGDYASTYASVNTKISGPKTLNDSIKAIPLIIISPYLLSKEVTSSCDILPGTLILSGAAPLIFTPAIPVGTAIVVGSGAIILTSIAVVKGVQAAAHYGPICYGFLKDLTSSNKHNKPRSDKHKKNPKPNKDNEHDKPIPLFKKRALDETKNNPEYTKNANKFLKHLTDTCNKIGRTKFAKIYKDPKTNLWWSKDTGHHGGDHFKVFKERSNGLEWKFNSDLLGNKIQEQHKGPVGRFIPFKEISFKN